MPAVLHGGKRQAHADKRDMFPATVQIVRKLRPKTFIVENVKGLTRSSFANYFEYIKLQLEFPEAPRRKHESWFDHLMRLQTEKTSGRMHESGLTYNVTSTLVNAADCGVPQKRERVFIVGTRSDLDIDWHFPDATHSGGCLAIYAIYYQGDFEAYAAISEQNKADKDDPTIPIYVGKAVPQGARMGTAKPVPRCFVKGGLASPALVRSLPRAFCGRGAGRGR